MNDFCDCDYGEPCDVWNQDTVKAKKIHTCSECQNQIASGDEYERISFLFDGEWDRLKICEYCWHDWKILKDLGYCVDIGTGDLEKAWNQHWTTPPVPSKPEIDHTFMVM